MRAGSALLLLLGTALAACDRAAPSIESTTQLADTADTVGPYTVHTVVVGAEGDVVELRYVIDDELHYIPRRMVADDGGGGELYIGRIPGQPAGSLVQYYVAVMRGDERVAVDPVGGGARPYAFRIVAAE
jgi:hypothetical protein